MGDSTRLCASIAVTETIKSLAREEWNLCGLLEGGGGQSGEKVSVAAHMNESQSECSIKMFFFDQQIHVRVVNCAGNGN